MQHDDQTIRTLCQHPDLQDIYTDRQLTDCVWVIEELARLGEMTLSAHDDGQIPGGMQIAWITTLRLRHQPTRPLMGTADSPHGAALRCLMEACCQLRRDMRGVPEDLLDH